MRHYRYYLLLVLQIYLCHIAEAQNENLPEGSFRIASEGDIKQLLLHESKMTHEANIPSLGKFEFTKSALTYKYDSSIVTVLMSGKSGCIMTISLLKMADSCQFISGRILCRDQRLAWVLIHVDGQIWAAPKNYEELIQE